MTGQQLLDHLNASDDPDQFVENLEFDDVVRLYEHASGYSACVDEWLDDDYPENTADLQTRILNLGQSKPSETLETVAVRLAERFKASDGEIPMHAPAQRTWAKRLRDALGLRHEEIGEPKPGDPDFVEPEPAFKVPTLREALEQLSKAPPDDEERIYLTGGYEKGLFCGVEDADTPDNRYDGARYGFQEGVDAALEWVQIVAKDALAPGAEPLKSIDDGGPMFPSHGSMGEVTHEGASVRHWFAGHAPQMPSEIFQLVADHIDMNNPNKTHREKCQALFDIVTEWRYMYADAMIEAGKKGGTS